MTLARRGSARIVGHERLGGRLLIDDDEAVGGSNDVLEGGVLVTRAKSEAIVLGPNVFVFLESHLHKRLTRDVISFRTTTFTKEFVRVFGPRYRRLLGRLVDLLDPFVDLPDESLVACLSFLTSVHGEVLRLHRPANNWSLRARACSKRRDPGQGPADGRLALLAVRFDDIRLDPGILGLPGCQVDV